MNQRLRRSAVLALRAAHAVRGAHVLSRSPVVIFFDRSSASSAGRWEAGACSGENIDFLGDSWLARGSLMVRNIGRGIPS